MVFKLWKSVFPRDQTIMRIFQSLNRVWLFATSWTAVHQAFTIFWSLPKFISTELVVLSNHLILCHPLLLLPSIFLTFRVFSNESALHIRWPTYWSFSISLSNDYSGLISLRIDWFDLLAVQGTLKSLSSTTIWKHKFFSAQPSLWCYSHSVHGYWKGYSLDYMDLCWQSHVLVFNMLFRFVIAFLPRSKCLNFMAEVSIHSDFWRP